MNKYTAEIERFLGHFEKEFSQVQSLQTKDGYHTAIYKKMIYVGIIDALSKCIYPRRGNRERFVMFLNDFSGWKYAQKVSLPHLLQLLERNPEPSFSKLRTYVVSEVAKWASGEIVTLDREPEINAIKRLWPNEKEHQKTLNGLGVEALQHCNLFYSYRNSLVHEFRESGRGIESIKEYAPYYISFSYLEEPDVEVWELTYPIYFFENLLSNCISEVKIYLVQNNINPYNFYKLGAYWIEELNF
ncbi:hypothetical protein [Geomonas paludis]|uniref:Uncharacterized protein n=1 Tax=Geomonas paludis TaxID=2740185 RepID=A0A6V8MRZ5_9BACT|nr:hypothetical protein [Geomonas paludis]GFO62517.1 hypothetical protein GMPD_04360 [Geomonas paludis]